MADFENPATSTHLMPIKDPTPSTAFKNYPVVPTRLSKATTYGANRVVVGTGFALIASQGVDPNHLDGFIRLLEKTNITTIFAQGPDFDEKGTAFLRYFGSLNTDKSAMEGDKLEGDANSRFINPHLIVDNPLYSVSTFIFMPTTGAPREIKVINTHGLPDFAKQIYDHIFQKAVAAPLSLDTILQDQFSTEGIASETLVHCRAGLGRTGIITFGVHLALHPKILLSKDATIRLELHKFRLTRPGMVQTEEQYLSAIQLAFKLIELHNPVHPQVRTVHHATLRN